jgi:CheY-like chemotaxis protein
MHILVVDDEDDAREMLAELLAAQGHDVRVAPDGEVALREASLAPPEVVLLDIELPGMSGYEVARRLRAEPATSRARLVALTGYAQEADRRNAERAGFDLLMPKPIKLAELSALLARYARG